MSKTTKARLTRSFYLFYQDRASIFQSAIGNLAPSPKIQTASDQSRIAQTLSGQSETAHEILPRPYEGGSGYA